MTSAALLCASRISRNICCLKMSTEMEVSNVVSDQIWGRGGGLCPNIK